jgi:exopolyphosphatase/guanosine-5'-triphosphate,3'-diphosphate pyrophosphatase
MPSSALAAIDMGSNSFRLEIAQVQHGRYRRIDYLKETVRLGAGLDGAGCLTDTAALRGLDCLRRFRQRLAGFAPEQIRAVATQTLREARNRDAFLVRAQDALGFPVEVISGREEARLTYAGVAFLQPSEQPRLVIDIGGRSTEMILGHGREARVAESFQVGSVSLSMRWFGDGRITEEAFRAAQIAAGAELEEALLPFAPRHWRQALGSSGTAGAVSDVLAAAGISDGRITPAGLRWCIARCLDAGHVDALRLPGLREDRRAIIVGGLSLLYTLASHFGINELQPARGALRQGVIIDLHERIEAALVAGGVDLRDRTVSAMQTRFHVDKPQAARVRAAAMQMYRLVVPAAGPEALHELGWACDLHETGLMLSHHDHHRHSAYLVAHIDAPGFSQSQQRRIADLVLAQRGGLRKVETLLGNDEFAWQAMVLRLAVIVCHARGTADGMTPTLSREGDVARLALLPAWTQTHPRTLHLLREEAQAWARMGSLRLVLDD